MGRCLQTQLKTIGLKVDEDHSFLFIFPLASGAALRGIIFWAADYFSGSGYYFFVESTCSFAMILFFLTRYHNVVLVYGFSLDNMTGVEGLAIEWFCGETLGKYINRVFIVNR